MGKSVVNPLYEQSANEVYAKGGLLPRRKGQRRISYDLFPDFPNQQGKVNAELEDRPNTIVGVQFLGTFLGYGHHGEELTYRAFAVTLSSGLVVAAYSLNADQYVMCLHTGYQAR